MSWWVDALCAEVGGDFWHPEKGGSTKAAKAICADCPVIAGCLEYALANNVDGIWGGTSERERRALRLAQRTDAA